MMLAAPVPQLMMLAAPVRTSQGQKAEHLNALLEAGKFKEELEAKVAAASSNNVGNHMSGASCLIVLVTWQLDCFGLQTLAAPAEQHLFARRH